MSDPMTQRDKLRALFKQIAVSAAMNAIPGTLQFLIEVGHKAYDLWIAAPPEERAQMRAEALKLNQAERDELIAGLTRDTGVRDRAAVDLMLQSLREMKSLDEDEALRSINQTLGQATDGQGTLTPSSRRARSGDPLTALSMSSHRAVEVGDRHAWPEIEGFEICGILGKGSAGVVYLALQVSQEGRVCALKVGDLVSERRFEREVRALSAVEHPHLITLWGSGTFSDKAPRYWIAMPNIGGLTLADVWRQGQLSLLERLRLMGEVLSGLVALHRAGIVHRDLKPANALVTPNLSVRLADFGLSKESIRGGQVGTVTQVGLEGTPAYMSPEQVEEVNDAGAEVDVWSFGVMLYEAVKGSRPFQGTNLMMLGRQITTESIDFSGDWGASELEEVIRQSLTRDRSKRYASAVELETPYREAVRVIEMMRAHQEQRLFWEWVEREQLLLNVETVDELSRPANVTHATDVASLAQSAATRLGEALAEIKRWRAHLTQLEGDLHDAEESLSLSSETSLQESAEVGQRALALDVSLKDQWDAWHQGLIEFEQQKRSAELEVTALQMHIKLSTSLLPDLHRSLTAWGRADYERRDSVDAEARAFLRDLTADLTRQVEEVRAQSETMGEHRVREFKRLKREGAQEGERIAKTWVKRLMSLHEADVESQSARRASAQSTLDQQLDVWRKLPKTDATWSETSGAWHSAIEDGSLVQFCLERALDLPADPTDSFPHLKMVSPHRLGEVLTVGVKVALNEALRRAQAEALRAVKTNLEQEVPVKLAQHRGEDEGLSRLTRAGYLIGLEEKIQSAINASPFMSLDQTWSIEAEREIDRALCKELSMELGDYEAVLSAQRFKSFKRFVFRLIILIAIVYSYRPVKHWWTDYKAREQCFKEARCVTEPKSGLVWIKISGGGFNRGYQHGDDNERPVQFISVKSFMMSESEVTVAQYQRCVDAKVCSAPKGRYGHRCNWGVSGREDHPINCITWFELNTFAKWVGGSLPAEAQWEYAARSRGADIRYPWGDRPATCDYTVMMGEGGPPYRDGCSLNRTSPVCSKRLGRTTQGLCDMSGNVSEWMMDEYHRYERYSNPRGEPICAQGNCSENLSRDNRVCRGSSWTRYNPKFFRTTYRHFASPRSPSEEIGGRVVRAIPPQQ